MSGKTIEHFQILRELGRGGMGIVYLAEDERLGRKVALKFLTDENLSREKILKEARLASQLQHPGIVTIYDVLESPSGTCIVMEYVEGDSLEHFLKTHRIDIPFALRLARQITEIVADAHQHNLIHGDLKPSNIIITPQGKPKLLDFGLAGLVSTPADTLSISGTFPYIAPEKIIGSPNTEQTDIYALGNIFYRLFTGISTFEKNHQSAQIYAIMHDKPRSPNQLNKKLPNILGDIILRCLEKEPKSRYTSAKVLLSDLNAVELSDIREKPGISPKAIWTNLLIFVVIFAILTFLFIKIQKAPEPVKSIEEISLPEPTRLSIDYKTPDEQDMTTQTRLLGLIEVLQDQLERVSGLDVILKNPAIETTLDTSGTSNNAENNLQIDLVKENDSYKIKYDLSNSDNSRRYNSSLNWKNFDDIFWVSNKLLSGIFKFLLDKQIILKNPPEDIQKNLLTFRYFSHGLYQFKEKYYQFAINNFNEALSINPFFAQAHYYKGLSLFNLQRYHDALKEFYDALPEAGKQNPIDWETPIFDKQDYYSRQFSIRTRKNSNLVSSGLYLFYDSGSRTIQIVNPKAQKVSQILLPRTFPPYRGIFQKFFYDNHLILTLITIRSRKAYLYVATYDFQTQNWSISSEYRYPYVTNLPFFYLIDSNLKKLIKFNAIEKRIVSSIDIPYSDDDKLIRLYLNPQQDILILSNHSLSAAYLVDLKNFTLQHVHDKIADMPGKMIYPELSDDYFFCTNEDTTRLKVMDLLTWKKIADIPLLKNGNYSFPYRKLKNDKTRIYRNALLVIQPDTCLHVYRFGKARNLTHIAQFALHSLAGEYRIIEAKYDTFNKEIFLYNNTDKKLMILKIDEQPAMRSIRLESNISQILINTKDFFIASNFSNIFEIDKKNISQIWNLPGSDAWNMYYSENKNIAIFNDTENKRLTFIQPSTRKILGFFPYRAGRNTYIDYYNDHVYFLDNNYFKSLDISNYIQRNPLHLANIYDNIARSYYEMGDYDKALKVTNKILTEFQPNSQPGIILEGKIFFRKKEYSQSMNSLLKAFKLLPEGNTNRLTIENALFNSGLYVWSRNVDLAEGNRLFEVLPDGILFTDSKALYKNQLIKLNRENGDIVWKYPYLYHFKGLRLSSRLLAYSDCESPTQNCSYKVLDMDKKENGIKLTSESNLSIDPQFYKYADNSMIAYFRKSDHNPSRLEFIDIEKKSVQKIFNSNELISDPFIYDNAVCFFTPAMFYFYDTESNKLSSREYGFEDNRNGTIFQILNISHGRIYVSTTKNEIFEGRWGDLKFSRIAKASRVFPGIAYSTNNEIVLFAKSGNISLQYENAANIKDMSIQGSKIYLLEPDYITCFENNKMTERYPLLWTAINFRIQGDRAYVLSSAGKIYAVNLNWRPNKLKKDLILSLN